LWVGHALVAAADPSTGVKLAFTVQPADTVAGAAMAPVVVQIQDATGIPVASNGVPIMLAKANGPGPLYGTFTRTTDAHGQAIFNDLSADAVGTNYQLTALAQGIGAGLTNGLSATWTVLAPTGAVRLAFTTQPADTLVGATMAPVVVQIQDATGVGVASNGVPIMLAKISGPGPLFGTFTRNTDANGKATFSDLSADTVGTDYQIAAVAQGIGAGLTNALSALFNITAPAAGGLQIISAALTPAGFVVSGVGPVPNMSCQLLASADVTAPATNWLVVASGIFDANAHISLTNPVSPALPFAAFRLRTSGTGP
jgi:hypothetical protein